MGPWGKFKTYFNGKRIQFKYKKILISRAPPANYPAISWWILCSLPNCVLNSERMDICDLWIYLTLIITLSMTLTLKKLENDIDPDLEICFKLPWPWNNHKITLTLKNPKIILTLKQLENIIDPDLEISIKLLWPWNNHQITLTLK